MQRRLAPLQRGLDLPLVQRTQYVSPGAVRRGMVEEREPVHRAVFAVEHMGELVQYDVVPLLRVQRPDQTAVPRQHDDAAGPRLAQRGPRFLVDLAEARHVHAPRVKCARVDQHAAQLGIAGIVEIEQQQARLRRDGDADLVGQLEADALHRLLVQEDLRTQTFGRQQRWGAGETTHGQHGVRRP